MASQNDLQKTIDRIDERISKLSVATHSLKHDLKKETWVKVGVITRLTGWNKHSLRRARESNLVKMKYTNKGYYYLLESIHPSCILKTDILV